MVKLRKSLLNLYLVPLRLNGEGGAKRRLEKNLGPTYRIEVKVKEVKTILKFSLYEDSLCVGALAYLVARLPFLLFHLIDIFRQLFIQ